MIYQDYLRHKLLRDTLKKKLEKASAIENAPIAIHDLIVSPDKNVLFGEAKTAPKVFERRDPIKRLLEHIDVLAQIANLYHQEKYCEPLENGQYQLKKEHFNTITRLDLHEFALYTRAPLTFSEFTELVQSLEKKAKNYHDNLHLLLSSFAVVNARQELLNTVIYMQCGQDVKFNIFTKRIAGDKDIQYPNAFINHSQDIDDQASDFVAYWQTEDDLISNKNIFEVHTKGGAKYLQAVDICFDHKVFHSKRLLLNQLAPNLDLNHGYRLPVQVDYIVTSNPTNIVEEGLMTAFVLHVDPSYKLRDEKNSTWRIDFSAVLQQPDIDFITRSSSPMTLNMRGASLRVHCPAFGPDYQIQSYTPRTLRGFIPGIAEAIDTINEIITKNYLDKMMQKPLAKLITNEFHQVEATKPRLLSSAYDLLEQLLLCCEVTYVDYLFVTKNYRLKQEAKGVIMSSIERLTSHSSDNFIALLPSWISDIKHNIQQVDAGLPHDSIDSMLKLISDYEQQIESELPRFFSPN